MVARAANSAEQMLYGTLLILTFVSGLVDAAKRNHGIARKRGRRSPEPQYQKQKLRKGTGLYRDMRVR